ncbi:MAG: hypothetical protein E7466_00715 [Ruminococcaceae bacterium]|nr:hypothetical protein [Oscillospiraceae bacterium]MBQ3214930.1 hypothetical protein [Oscillospiraceae bacterium]
MGLPTVKDAVMYLVKYGIKADIGNPGSVMPHLGGVVVAVNTHKASLTEKTLVGTVCAPQKDGMTACESLASLIATYWCSQGAETRWGEYSFDSKAAMHMMKVYGTWTNTETDT